MYNGDFSYHFGDALRDFGDGAIWRYIQLGGYHLASLPGGRRPTQWLAPIGDPKIFHPMRFHPTVGLGSIAIR